MITVNGIYENGQVTLLEPIPFKKKSKVLVTVLDEVPTNKDLPAPLDLFDDLIGAISQQEDGASEHDRYIYMKASQ